MGGKRWVAYKDFHANKCLWCHWPSLNEPTLIEPWPTGGSPMHLKCWECYEGGVGGDIFVIYGNHYLLSPKVWQRERKGNLSIYLNIEWHMLHRDWISSTKKCNIKIKGEIIHTFSPSIVIASQSIITHIYYDLQKESGQNSWLDLYRYNGFNNKCSVQSQLFGSRLPQNIITLIHQITTWV